MISKTQILEREKRWTLIAGIASVMGVAVILATYGDSSAAVRASSGLAERLGEVDGDRARLVIASVGQFLGWSLLAIPLVFLFRAAAARSPQVRTALIGVMIAAPVLIGAGSLVSAGSILQAATDYKDVSQSTIDRCVTDKVADEGGTAEESGATGEAGSAGSAGESEGAVTAEEREDFRTECEDEEAQDIRAATSLAGLETGIGLAGLLGFTVAIIYVSLWSMRMGLLTRFWGSLGIALGAVFAFFTLFTLIWFIYLGLLLAGWVPGGRPPAWAAGEGIPWPKPGRPESDDDVIEGTSDEVDPAAEEPVSAPEPGTAPEAGGEAQAGLRKRKKRNG